MNTNITITDGDYKKWVKDLALRYRRSQIKAAVKINTEQLWYNWRLGKDIVEMNVEQRWGERVIGQLSNDLREALPGVQGLSKSNIYYCKKFYLLYNGEPQIFQQLVGKTDADEVFQQLVGKLEIPWGHHCIIMDKVKGDVNKALFYISQTIENGWSRAVLLNMIGTNLYERHGKALTNFKHSLPEAESDLAREITKDPYNFAFAEITGRYNEKKLKDALLTNISKFLIELGTGFAYVGKEYRLQIGETENFIDLLFYNIKLRCYVAIEVKIDKFASRDIGQLGTYVTAVNHILREEGKDNPTIGLLICKSKDNTLAQYALESSSQPLGISEYELERFYPEKVEGTIPTIAEIEESLKDENTGTFGED
ncbi:MAG: PDDEXK nuclease domain-containing protein [Prevotella sp.]|nr:PDDEXK nuclease domain-containing protein [Prevotella sp.]